MSIKSILAPLTGQGDGTHVVACALKLAQRLHAHVTVTPAVGDRLPFIDPTGISVSPAFYDDLLKALEKAAAHARSQARHQFDAAVRAAKVAIVDKPPCSSASTYWYDDAGLDRDDPVAVLGRLADLVVVNRGSAMRDTEVIEDALFAAHRPVLALPQKVSEIGRRAAVAWNGSMEACNALEHGLDLLEPGSEIAIIQVGRLAPGRAAASEAVKYAGWHGFAVSIREVEDRPSMTAQIILREAHQANAGLLVMGAYTHSRVREVMLGGVTATMLKQADIPLLLAH